MHGEERESLIASVDEDRWALYYGIKALSRELPEARLFYNFLDEKYGEDELTFFLHCLRTLDAEAWRPGRGGIDWGKILTIDEINELYKQQVADGVDEDDNDDEDLRLTAGTKFCPTVVFVTNKTVNAVVDVVMNSAQDEVKAALKRNLLKKTAPVDAKRLPEAMAERLKRRLHRISSGNDDDAFADLDQGVTEDGEQSTVNCVEAGGLLRGLLQEYREEQAHRRAAVKLMFQTATNPGGDDPFVVDEESGGGGPTVAAPASIDMQQFRSMCESLHSNIPFNEVVALYRDSHELGDGNVNFDSFSKAAEMRQFFSMCLRLPQFVGAAERAGEIYRLMELEKSGTQKESDENDSEEGAKDHGKPESFTREECSMLAATISRHVKLFEVTLDEQKSLIHGNARTRLNTQLQALNYDIMTTCGGTAPDGRRALCSYRRVLDTLLYQRLERLQEVPEAGGVKRLDQIDRELTSIETVLREFTVAPAVVKLQRVMRFVSAIRIQRCFRGMLRKTAGVPLALRPMMDKRFCSMRAEKIPARSEPWLLDQLDTILYDKLLSDAGADAARLPRKALREFIYDHHLYRYGIRRIAEKQLHTLFYNIRRHAATHSRARVFALCLGMGKELKIEIGPQNAQNNAARQAAEMMGTKVTPEDWLEKPFGIDFYLRLVSILTSESKTNRGCLFPYHRSEEGTGRSSLPTEQVVEAVNRCLGHEHEGANVYFTENEMAVVSMRIREKSDVRKRVDLDDVLELLMGRWAIKMRNREVELRKIFRAGDIELNKVLSFDEFYAMAHS